MSDTINLNTSIVQQSLWRSTLRQFRRHRLASASLALLVVFILLAVFANVISPYNPNDIDPRAAGVTRGFPQQPSIEHPFGTDDLNRDIFARLLYGMRVSLAVGFLAMFISIGLGVTIGALAGYTGGLLDNILMRLVDIFLSVPSFILFLALNSIFVPSIWTVVLILSAFSWMDVARLVRAEFLAIKEREFVVAAHAVGAAPLRIILVHLLPNALAPVLVAATLAIPAAILSESALSFIGLGVPPPNASLGNLLQDAKAWLTSAWWLWVTPGLVISLTVLAFNFVGDGLRDAFDPTLRR
ncbi:MAG: ABC transporter permease [Chloroflexi bacterium]|nr:ABC transporter permease [Chloroflexota bacterium]MCC6895883.1 ABC transporter permease [Anaerolineae bacterium]